MREGEFYMGIAVFLGKMVADFHEESILRKQKEPVFKMDREYRKKHPYCCVIRVAFQPGALFPNHSENTEHKKLTG